MHADDDSNAGPAPRRDGQPSSTPFHHTANGYRNNYPQGWTRGSFLRWQRERWRDGLPRIPPGGWHFPARTPNAAWLRANRTEPTLTWLGHATFLLQLDGQNVLTDPHLSPRASPFATVGPKRCMPPAIAVQALPHIDTVVISHNHYDHLDTATVKRLARQPGGPPRFYVPLGLSAWFARKGIDHSTELDWWDQCAAGPLTLTCTPVQHWSARTAFDRNRTLWCGWRVDASRFSFFFAGDTGYSPDFVDIHRRLGPVDLAALPIGAYAPRWFMQVMHADPDDAVQIYRDLHARHAVAMHWGTFVLTDEPLDEPPQRLRRALAAAGLDEHDFWLLQHGETRTLTLRPAPADEHA